MQSFNFFRIFKNFQHLFYTDKKESWSNGYNKKSTAARTKIATTTKIVKLPGAAILESDNAVQIPALPLAGYARQTIQFL